MPSPDATLDSFIQQEYIGVEEDVKVPDLHESVSRMLGQHPITVCNLSCTDSKDVDTILVGAKLPGRR